MHLHKGCVFIWLPRAAGEGREGTTQENDEDLPLESCSVFNPPLYTLADLPGPRGTCCHVLSNKGLLPLRHKEPSPFSKSFLGKKACKHEEAFLR